VRWIQPLPTICWEASDQRTDMKRHPLPGGRFMLLGPALQRQEHEPLFHVTLKPATDIDTPEVTLVPAAGVLDHLQGDPSACSIEIAY